MTEHLRRAVPRQPADCFGSYRFDNDDREPWRCCRIIDISPLGVGLELFAISTDEDLSGPITIQSNCAARLVTWFEATSATRRILEWSLPRQPKRQRSTCAR